MIDVGEIARTVDGATVSIDVSTCDADAGDRVFGRVYSAQYEGDGSLTLLAEPVEDNRLPTLNRLRELADWLVSLDDVEGPGAEARRTVTLTQIINRAREALGVDR